VCGLTKESLIADIGSGTGLLSEVFLKNAMLYLGIEPNELMRAKAERLLKSFARFRSVAAAAENTTLRMLRLISSPPVRRSLV